MSKKSRFKPRVFESANPDKDVSANIYRTMLFSEAFLDLSKNERILYVYIKSQFYGVKKPDIDLPDIDPATLFVFPFSLAKQSGLYSEGNKARFYSDMESLISHGFLRKVICGKANHQRNIYCYAADWRFWTR